MVSFKIKCSSQAGIGEIQGFFGNFIQEDVAGFSVDRIGSEHGDWLLYVGRDRDKDVFVRDSVGGTAVTILIDRDDRGVREEVVELLGALVPFEAVIASR